MPEPEEPHGRDIVAEPKRVTGPRPKHGSPPNYWAKREADFLEIIALATLQNERLLSQRNCLVDEVLRLKRAVERMADQIQRDSDRVWAARQEIT